MDTSADNGSKSTANPLTAVAGPSPSSASHGKDSKSIQNELNNIPLFMRELSEDNNDNIALEALKSLAYDGPPEEISENFKNQGNDCFKARKYRDAVDYYTKGLDPDHGNINLKVTLLINRAAANLALENYGKVLQDCSEALRLKPETPKALYRSAKACLALGKFDEAIECCKWGAGIDQNNTEFDKLEKQIIAEKEKLEKKIREREERKRKLAEDREKLNKAIGIRNLKFDSTKNPRPSSPDNESEQTQEQKSALSGKTASKVPYPWENDSGRQVSLDEQTGHLVWPVFFLYPEYKESDFVEKFDEAYTLGDMLQEVLAQPPPWDDQAKPKYTIGNVDTYFIHRPVGGFDEDESLVKVGLGTRLGSILQHSKYVIRDGIPSFIVLPRGESFTDEFIDRYRKLRQARENARKTQK